MSDIVSIADHAAQETDRWLFICAVVLLIAFALIIWRWIVADRDKLSNRLTEITDRHIESSERLAEVVANNTNALREVRDCMHRARKPEG